MGPKILKALAPIAKDIVSFLEQPGIRGLRGVLLRSALSEAIARGDVVSDEALDALSDYSASTKKFEDEG